MFGKIFKLINEQLWLRLLIPVSVIVIIVVFTNLWYNISFQVKSGETQLKTQNNMLAKAVEGGMFDALAIGDNDTVRTQFKRLNNEIKDLKVFVYDFDGVVSFSTDIDSVGKKMSDFLDEDSKKDVSAMLDNGNSSDQSFHVSFDGTPFLLKNETIINEKRCFHCHGGERKVLGGISVFSSEKAVQQAINTGQKVSIIIGVAGLGVIILFIWLFFHFLVNKKVQMVLDATSKMRQKDFTHTYDVKQGDEINHILSRINLVTDDLRGTIKQVVDNSDIINNSASDLSEISENLNSASTDAFEKATTVSAASEEMSINNKNIATSMEQSTDTLNAIASAIEEMSATVNEIAHNVNSSKEITEQVVGGFELISQVVEELGDQADDVDIVTDEIRSIAEQVSMLALNAKVEAARAGDAGKGFAVVAQEITELASETNKSTLKADEKLQWIKEKSREVAKKVTGLTSIVKEADDAMTSISAAVDEQNVTTQEIAKNINDVSSEISEVNYNVTEGATVASEIAKEITIVEEGSKQVQKNSNRLNDNAMSLSTMAESFMELVKQFKV
ncbi:MAG: methyl-accepting chemotaxis protein [Desulfobacteraceae bacterium]|nr:methyl-accepting chemotaxis protein [Desulfobacteraceae bacterium]